MPQSESATDDPGWLSAGRRSVVEQGKESFSIFWIIAWKVMSIATLILGCLFVWCLYHVVGESGDRLQAFCGVTILFGQGLFCCGVLSLAAGAFAVTFRWFGAWLFIPIIGAILGSVVTLAIAFEILKGCDFPTGRSHGGGEIVVLLLLGYFAIAGIVGAVCGSIVFVGLAMFMNLVSRRHSGSSAVAEPMPSTTDEIADVGPNTLVNRDGRTKVT